MRTFAALILLGTVVFSANAQNPAATAAAKPGDRLIGEVTGLDLAAGSMTVKEDATNAAFSVKLTTTKAILQVPPGEKDLKKATRVALDQLAVGDRVVIRGNKPEGTTGVMNAASILVMTASDLQQKRKVEAADWQQRGMAGIVQSVDPAAQRLVLTERTQAGPKQVSVSATDKTELTRFVPTSPKVPATAKLTEIAVGDQARVLGSPNADGSEVTAEKIYTGSFKTVPGNILSISADATEVTVTDFRSKQPVKISLNTESVIRRLPAPLAASLANRTTGTGSGGPNSAGPVRPETTATQPRAHGDMSQMLEKLPPIAVTELKPGDAVIVFGATGANGSSLVATNIVAGVEPLLQSTPRSSGRQGGSPVDNWNLDFGLPAQ